MPGTVRWAKRNSVSESVSTAQWERLLADLERLFADPERLSAGRLRPFAVESTHLLFATSQQSESNGARFFHPIPNTQQHPFILSFIQVFPQSQCQLPPCVHLFGPAVFCDGNQSVRLWSAKAMSPTQPPVPQ